MLVYVAMDGEYEVDVPLGVFNNFHKALNMIKESNPTYDTHIYMYDITTGERIRTFYIDKKGEIYAEQGAI